MINLLDTTDTLKLVSGSAAALAVHVSGVTGVAGSGAWSAPYRKNTAVASATTTGIAAAAGSGNFTTVKNVSVVNTDAVLSCQVAVEHDISGTAVELYAALLLPGQVMSYEEGLGWFVSTPTVIPTGLVNVSVADQALAASSTTYITGSAIALPYPVPVGLVMRWRLSIGKTTAGGTVAGSIAIYFGTNGSTSDTSRCSATMDTETAATDEALDEVHATIRGPITSACIVQSLMTREDNNTTTGFSNTARKGQVRAVQSAGFDITPVGMFAGLVYVLGASNGQTVRQVTAELLAVGN